MNLKITAAVLFAVAFSSCVRVEMPEHMVSDAVGAGKDLYRSVERAFDKQPKTGVVESNSEGSEYWLISEGSSDQPVAELKRQCLTTLVAGARAKAGMPDLEYRVIDQRVEAKDTGVVAKCQIAVEHAPAS
ncbi:MAG: hypothetical protein IPJ65_43500 [Archangiaceae bacterium]|nr:hypothetical protein [Archangiaceae bacterium]